MGLFEKAAELAGRGQNFVTVTILATRGHAPQDPGAKALITTDGLYAGTVGGGKLEAQAIIRSKTLLSSENKTKAPLREVWNLQRDVGMSCGGEVEILFELHQFKQWEVVVFGAGHVAQALVRLLLTLNGSVVCVDHRQEWLDKLPAESLNLKKVRLDPLEDFIKLTEPPDRFYAVMTMGHATDFPILKKILETQNPRYIGVLGSAVKALKIRKELRDAGISEDRISKLRSPMGLLDNANDPAEIAISIGAEILKCRDQPEANI